MSFIVRNKTTNAVTVNDLGLWIPAGIGSPPAYDYNMAEEDPVRVASSSDLQTLIGLGTLVVLDPLDGTTELSSSEGQVVCGAHNDPHYRIRGGKLDQLGDVSLSAVASTHVLQFNGTSWTNVPGSSVVGIAPSQHIHIAKNGSDVTGNGTVHNPYASISHAISTITDSSATKPYLFTAHPGVYVEDPFNLPEYTCLEGSGPTITIITASNNSQPLILASSNACLTQFGTNGPTSNATVSGNDLITNFTAQQVHFISGQSAVVAEGVGSSPSNTERLQLIDCRILSGVQSGVVALNGGRIACSNVISEASVVAFQSDGQYSNIQCRSTLARFSTDAYQVDNGGTIEGSGLLAEYCTNTLHVGASLGSPYLTQSAFDIAGLRADNTTSLDIYVEHENSDVRVIGASLDVDKIQVPATYPHLHLLMQDPGGPTDPEAIIYATGTLSVGRIEQGSTTWLGQGNPNSRGMVVLTTDNTATSTTDGGNFVDVSEIAAHRDMSTTFSFQGTTTNHTILVGVDLTDLDGPVRHWGYIAHTKIATVEVTPKSFAIEIWTGSQWTEVGVMVVDYDESYRYSNTLFIRPNNIEVVRLGVDNNTTWTSKTINGKNLRWSRIRIATSVTTAPTFHHLNMTPSTAEINVDGTMSFHGRARFRQTVIAAGNIYGESGGVTSINSDVGTGGIPTGWGHSLKNSYMNTKGDAIYMQFVLPRGVCTSCPFRVRVVYEVLDAGASTDGSIIISVLPLQVAGNPVADPAGGTIPVARSVTSTELVTAKPAFSSTHAIEVATDKKLHSTTSDGFVLDDFYEGDMVAIRVEYDDDGSGNKNIVIWSLEVNAAVWTHGERL